MAIAGTTWNVITVSMRQRLIPAELFGRVNSVYRFIGTGSTAFGALIGGQIAYSFGLRATYLASGIVLLVALITLGPVFLRAAKFTSCLSEPLRRHQSHKFRQLSTKPNQNRETTPSWRCLAAHQVA